MAGAPSSLTIAGSITNSPTVEPVTYASDYAWPSGAEVDVSGFVPLGWGTLNITYNEITWSIPWLNILTFALNILELAGIIPDPFNLLFSQFAGRPKEEATIQVSQRLCNCRNPAAREFGILLQRMLVEWGIVISVGGSGRSLLDYATRQFVDNLQAQGISQSRAFEILNNAMSRSAQAGAPCDPELTQALDPTLNFLGPQGSADDMIHAYEYFINQGQTIPQALKSMEQYRWKHEPLDRLRQWRINIWKQPTPPPQQILPDPQGKCPPGYYLDQTTELCLIGTQPQPGPGPGATPQPGPGPGPGPGTGPDPQGDEITQTLCAQIQSAAQSIVDAVSGMQPGATPNPTPNTDCCNQIVGAIEDIVHALGTIAASLGGSSVDVSGIVSALNSLVAAVSALAPSPPPDLTAITQQLANIANAIAGDKTDTKPIVDAINAFAKIVDVSQPTIDYLVQQGFLDSQTAQVISPGAFGDSLVGIARTALWSIVQWIANFFGVTWNGSTWVLNAEGTEIENIVRTFINVLLTAPAVPMYPEIKGLIDGVVAQLDPTGPVSYGNAQVDPELLLSKTLSPTLVLKVLAFIAELVPALELGEGVEKMVEKIEKWAGLEEVKEIIVGQKMRYGPIRQAQLEAMKLFRQEGPNAGTAADWLARGIISSATATSLYELAGLPQEFETATSTGATRGMNARQMLRLIETDLFSDTDIADELTFSGMRTTSQHRMLLAAPYLATQPQRSQLHSALEAAYTAGLLDDPTYQSNIDSAEQNTNRDNLLLQVARWKLLTSETKMLEKEYTDMYIGGVIDDATFRADLAGIGLQPGYIDIIAGVAEARANVTLQKKNLREAAALQKATDNDARKSAMAQFKSGTYDQAALAAALVATGLSPAQVAARTTLAGAQQAGSQRWIYGLLKTPQEAALLRERVTALTDQRKRLQIDDVTYLNQLQALGLPPRVVNALNAAANSMITPKTAAILTPVQTS